MQGSEPTKVSEWAMERARKLLGLNLSQFYPYRVDQVARALDAAVLAERERCAKVCEDHDNQRLSQNERDEGCELHAEGHEFAAAIRKGDQ